jgi:photosystem II stability/assembly factor-like uncharacterized protein
MALRNCVGVQNLGRSFISLISAGRWPLRSTFGWGDGPAAWVITFLVPTMNWPLGSVIRFALGVAAAGGLLTTCFPAAAATTLYELAQVTHFHGLAVDAADSSRLYLATHDGLFIVETKDGTVYPFSEIRHDLMGFTPDPRDPSTLYASGHPAGGGNLGLIASEDGGRSWRQLAPGVGGPADFHQLTVSATVPRTVYGAYRGQLQVSPDGGRTWEVVGAAPEGLIDLAASSKEPGRLYAATHSGVLKSGDGGRVWQYAYRQRQPATMVHVARGGMVYAFVVGTGLIAAAEPELSWQSVSEHGFGADYVLHLAVDPAHDGKLYAITFNPQTKTQAVLASTNAGKTWAPLGSGTH